MLHELTRQPAAPDAAAASAETPPDWSAQKDDIFCPLCDYNLRGLIEPRCPECGYRFSWPELLEAHRRIHPWLFEHHPESNFRSYLATARAIQRPSRFWPTLHPAQPSRPGRMLAFWLVGVVLFMISFAVCAAALLGLLTASRTLSGWPEWSGIPIVDFSEIVLHGAMRFVLSVEFLQLQYWCAALAVGWPSVTIASLLIFQATMKRKRIRAHHVARCVFYSADVTWLAVALPMATVPVLAWFYLYFELPLVEVEVWFTLACLTTFIVFAHRLKCALNRYLKLEYAAGVLLASQAIVLLFWLNLWLGDTIGWRW